jgi:hypothetical protein
MSDIPGAREELAQMAQDLKSIGLVSYSNRLNRIIEEKMVRTPYARKAQVTSAQLSPNMVKDIKKFLKDNPNMALNKVAEKFEVNPGRISEILHGKWG